jgi:antitoxin (DNA-binding transcriptional repressor) of toxin-antitoxin stability system
VKTITQREFRTNSAAVMDAVEGGETCHTTHNGVEVAELGPLRRGAAAAAFRSTPATRPISSASTACSRWCPSDSGYQPRARHSGSDGRSLPSVVSSPWPG